MQRHASLWGVEREQEVLLAFALPTVGAGGARNLVATKEPRAEPRTARPMGVVGVANS